MKLGSTLAACALMVLIGLIATVTGVLSDEPEPTPCPLCEINQHLVDSLVDGWADCRAEKCWQRYEYFYPWDPLDSITFEWLPLDDPWDPFAIRK